MIAKKFSIFIMLCFSSFVIGTSFGATCPTVQNSNPAPAGWSMLIPPIDPEQDYYFLAAIHSMNGAFYDHQVICKYVVGDCEGCFAYALVSDATYNKPYEADPLHHWKKYERMDNAFICKPGNKEPMECEFSN